MADVAVANPFRTEQPSGQLRQSTTEVAVQRELAEVQAAVLMARRFPRDPVQAIDAILRACTRQTLAASALYSYARGGTDITGPSIRLAEVMAQSWCNLAFGVRELEQRAGESTMEAYCWDLETNVRQARVFQVKHERHTRERSYRLTDPRDIYEQNANQGARRLRACILGVIPGDVVEAAVSQCEETLKATDTSPEAIKKMVDAFAAFGVTQAQIEARCQRRAEAIRPAQIVQLRKIFSSLKDEMSQPADWFEPAAGAPAAANLRGNEALRSQLQPEIPPMAEGEQEEPAAKPEPTEAEPPAPPRRPRLGQPGALAARRNRKEEPTEVEIERSQEMTAAVLGPEEVAALDEQTLPPEASKIEVIKPQRLPRDAGWDWPTYADALIAAALRTPIAELGRYRGANASMFDVLRASDREQWERVNKALADYERDGVVGS